MEKHDSGFPEKVDPPRITTKPLQLGMIEQITSKTPRRHSCHVDETAAQHSGNQQVAQIRGGFEYLVL